MFSQNLTQKYFKKLKHILYKELHTTIPQSNSVPNIPWEEKTYICVPGTVLSDVGNLLSKRARSVDHIDSIIHLDIYSICAVFPLSFFLINSLHLQHSFSLLFSLDCAVI